MPREVAKRTDARDISHVWKPRRAGRNWAETPQDGEDRSMTRGQKGRLGSAGWQWGCGSLMGRGRSSWSGSKSNRLAKTTRQAIEN